jgi:hypothetical protein
MGRKCHASVKGEVLRDALESLNALKVSKFGIRSAVAQRKGTAEGDPDERVCLIPRSRGEPFRVTSEDAVD